MASDCVRPTQFHVIQTIHCNVGLKCFHQNLLKCLFVIIGIHSHFSHIPQGSVKTGLRGGAMYRYCKLSAEYASENKFWKSVNNWQRCGQK